MLAVVTNFFDNIFEITFTTNRLPKSLTQWVSVELIGKCVLGSPYCLKGPVILAKGSLRLIGTLMNYTSLSWVS